MSESTRRSLIAYYMHGHVHANDNTSKDLDYSELFTDIHNQEASERICEFRDRHIAIPRSVDLKSGLALMFVSGDKDGSILTLDLETSDAEREHAGINRLFVQSRWVIVEPKSRLAILESKRPTVGIDEIEFYLERHIGKHKNSSDPEFHLNKIPNKKFSSRIEEFTRIREAAIVLTRPNSAWTDSANSLVKGAASSGASAVEVAARASRKKSLSKREGIVPEMIDLAETNLPFIKNARVTGNMPGSEGETTVSLENSPMRKYALVNRSDSPMSQLKDMSSAIDALLEEVDSRDSGLRADEIN